METNKNGPLPKILTYESLVFEFIEPHGSEWYRLPYEVKRLIVKSPEMFCLIPSEKAGQLPLIKYDEVTFRFDTSNRVWVLDSIVPSVPCPF